MGEEEDSLPYIRYLLVTLSLNVALIWKILATGTGLSLLLFLYQELFKIKPFLLVKVWKNLFISKIIYIIY
jgi:hypothetical protein